MEESIINRLDAYASALDSKGVSKMKDCLSDNVVVELSTFKGEIPASLNSMEYIEECLQSLKNLNTTHTFSKHKILMIEDKAHCQCDFSIKRFDVRQNEYFHSYGKFTFILQNENSDWKIEKIVQMVEKNEGLDLIHGAFSLN